ncbi:hypothetical protein C8R46DRAFT_1042116 [Mycena filopes]|nr:hypothetical protein C8R46DRAFT_1042116 [Mycena filopes]
MSSQTDHALDDSFDTTYEASFIDVDLICSSHSVPYELADITPFQQYLTHRGILSRDRSRLEEFAPSSSFLATPTFGGVSDLLPLCRNVQSAYERVGETHVNNAPVYFTVDNSDRIVTTLDEAAVIWNAVGYDLAEIYVTISLEEARDRASVNRARHLELGGAPDPYRRFVAASTDDPYYFADTVVPADVPFPADATALDVTAPVSAAASGAPAPSSQGPAMLLTTYILNCPNQTFARGEDGGGGRVIAKRRTWCAADDRGFGGARRDAGLGDAKRRNPG